MFWKDDIQKLKEGYRTLGAARFWMIMLATFAWIGAGAGAAIALDYPSAFGSSCHRKCLIESFWYSPTLLSDGRLLAYTLFAWLWSMPAAIIAALIYRLSKRNSRSNRIQPLD